MRSKKAHKKLALLAKLARSTCSKSTDSFCFLLVNLSHSFVTLELIIPFVFGWTEMVFTVKWSRYFFFRKKYNSLEIRKIKFGYLKFSVKNSEQIKLRCRPCKDLKTIWEITTTTTTTNPGILGNLLNFLH